MCGDPGTLEAYPTVRGKTSEQVGNSIVSLSGFPRQTCFSGHAGLKCEGISHRRRTKVHDYSLPGNPFYAYDETNVRLSTMYKKEPMGRRWLKGILEGDVVCG